MNIIPINFDLSKYKDNFENINIFAEHVFSEKGKAKLKKIDKCWALIKEELNKEVTEKGKKFNPKEFYKHPIWNDLGQTIQEVFGFRFVDIAPYPEKAYAHDKDKMFVYVNAYTQVPDETRFSVNAMITDNGFYDKSHSMMLYMTIGNPLLQILEPEELTATFLHEMGHNLDPSLYNINYKDINDYVSYILDTDKDKFQKEIEAGECWINRFVTLMTSNADTSKKSNKGFIGKAIKSSFKFIWDILDKLLTFLLTLEFRNPFNQDIKKVTDKLVDKTKKKIKERGMFSKYNSTEAFADNFPRMYGYGKALLMALEKMGTRASSDAMETIYGKNVFNRANIEKIRSQFFAIVIRDSIDDVHKTDIHRYYSLMKECYKDLKNKSIPPEIKKQIQKDLDEMIKLGDMFFKSPDEVRNKVYASIFNAIKETDPDAVAEMPSAPKQNNLLRNFLKLIKFK